MNKKLIDQIARISLSMFRKNFFGVFHGSISAKIEHNKFIINKREAIFDEIDEDSLIVLYHNRDYRWNDASIDASIHSNIYQNIPDAKFVAYGMPPYTTAYSIRYNKIAPIDYFGYITYKEIPVYDPKQLDDWYERADVEICRYMKENSVHLMVIKGYGVYVYHRDLNQMAKSIAILENSCRLLYLSRALNSEIDQKDLYYI